jgi:hypothetical protein
MRRVLMLLPVALIAVTANAQWRRFGNGDFGRGPERHGDRLDVVERALHDVDTARPYRNYRELERARKDLLKFQDKWYSGRFDRGKLDGAIGHIDRIVHTGSLDPRDRRVLERDLWDLRALRDNRRDGRGFDRGWRFR